MACQSEKFEDIGIKTVLPHQIHHNDFLGYKNFQRHFMFDPKWNVNTLNDNYIELNKVLKKQLEFKRNVCGRRKLRENYFRLRQEVHAGRMKLSNILVGDNEKKLQKCLRKHRQTQLFCRHKPLPVAKETMNNRTFVMRKELDRRKYKLDQLMKIYEEKLKQLTEIQCRSKSAPDSELPEIMQCRVLEKQLVNSRLRLRAFKSINLTYGKMLETLQYDQKFYPSILKSLATDMEEQQQYIEYIVHIGRPAMLESKKLLDKLKTDANISSKTRLTRMQSQFLAQYKSMETLDEPTDKRQKQNLRTRYSFATRSMTCLANRLNDAEKTVNKLKAATLSSRATEVFPRMRALVEGNTKLHKIIIENELKRRYLHMKQQHTEVFRSVLSNHISRKASGEYIQNLKDEIADEDLYSAKLSSMLSERNETFAVIRMSLWKMLDTLVHVGSPIIPEPRYYRSSYLRLPLLKFENDKINTCPPEAFEHNLENLSASVKQKVQLLLNASSSRSAKHTDAAVVKNYQEIFVESINNEVMEKVELVNEKHDETEDLTIGLIGRKEIKEQSQQLVEEHKSEYSLK